MEKGIECGCLNWRRKNRRNPHGSLREAWATQNLPERAACGADPPIDWELTKLDNNPAWVPSTHHISMWS
jgi:hypothetical protein